MNQINIIGTLTASDFFVNTILLKHKGYLFGIESYVERTGGIGSSGR